MSDYAHDEWRKVWQDKLSNGETVHLVIDRRPFGYCGGYRGAFPLLAVAGRSTVLEFQEDGTGEYGVSLLPIEPHKPKQVRWDSVLDIPLDEGPVWIRTNPHDVWRMITGVKSGGFYTSTGWFLMDMRLLDNACYHVGDIRDVLTGKVEPKPCMKDAT